MSASVGEQTFISRCTVQR